MPYDLRRSVLAALLAVGVLLGLGTAPAAAAEPVAAPLVQLVQFYGPGPGYYRGPPRYYRHRYYGRPFYGRPVFGPRPGFYGPRRGFYQHHGYYGRRFYR